MADTVLHSIGKRQADKMLRDPKHQMAALGMGAVLKKKAAG